MKSEDWPQWRGIERDGIIAKPIAPSDEPKLNWTAEISGGYSGPTVANGKVYVMDRVTEPNQIERVHCFDQATGENVWTHQYDALYIGIGYPTGPRASVTIQDGKAYSIGSMGHAFCLDAENGEVIWKIDFNEQYKIVASKRMPIWGISGSPLIVGSNVVFHVGGSGGACIVAIDRESGKETWRALDDRAQYCTPVLMENNSMKSIVCWTGDSISALDPETGNVHWRFENKPRKMPIGIATPLIQNGHIFVTSFYDGSLMLKVNDDGKDGQHVVVKIKAGVCVVAVDSDRNIHLTKEFYYAVGRDSIEAVSGGVEPDEDADLTAKRELQEELGLEAESWKFLTTVDPFTTIMASPTRLYLATGLSEVDTDPEGTELIEHVVIPLADAAKMVASGEITHAPSCVAILMADQNLM